MNINYRAAAIFGIAIVSLAVPAQANQASALPNAQAIAQNTLTAREIVAACVQDRAETLPNPFLDVPANHWAYKAVLTLHYCGVIRPSTPPAVIDRLLNAPTQRVPSEETPAAPSQS